MQPPIPKVDKATAKKLSDHLTEAMCSAGLPSTDARLVADMAVTASNEAVDAIDRVTNRLPDHLQLETMVASITLTGAVLRSMKDMLGNTAKRYNL